MNEILSNKFSQKGTIEILLMLLEKKRKTTEITALIYPQTAYRALSILAQFGLVITQPGKGNTTFYMLSEKGRRVAKKLLEIEEILKEKSN